MDEKVVYLENIENNLSKPTYPYQCELISFPPKTLLIAFVKMTVQTFFFDILNKF